VERAPNEGVVSDGAEKLLIEAVVIEEGRELEWIESERFCGRHDDVGGRGDERNRQIVAAEGGENGEGGGFGSREEGYSLRTCNATNAGDHFRLFHSFSWVQRMK